eukprot:Seg1893.2 transcript_id=Seg1893.2/GoldUCD/mRNA.D3Y31 product="hypothetical protein" protein_id=Seg1893.2/GoldUCD/D3Y31
MPVLFENTTTFGGLGSVVFTIERIKSKRPNTPDGYQLSEIKDAKLRGDSKKIILSKEGMQALLTHLQALNFEVDPKMIIEKNRHLLKEKPYGGKCYSFLTLQTLEIERATKHKILMEHNVCSSSSNEVPVEERFFRHSVSLNRWNLVDKQGNPYEDGARPSKINISLKDETIKKMQSDYVLATELFGEVSWKTTEMFWKGEEEEKKEEKGEEKKEEKGEEKEEEKGEEKKDQKGEEREEERDEGIEASLKRSAPIDEASPTPTKKPKSIQLVRSKRMLHSRIVKDPEDEEEAKRHAEHGGIAAGLSHDAENNWSLYEPKDAMAREMMTQCVAHGLTPTEEERNEKAEYLKRINEAHSQLILQIIMDKTKQYCPSCEHEMAIISNHVAEGRSFKKSLLEHVETPVVKDHKVDCLMVDFSKFFFFHAAYVNQVIQAGGFDRFYSLILSRLGISIDTARYALIGVQDPEDDDNAIEALNSFLERKIKHLFNKMKNTKDFRSVMLPIVRALQKALFDDDD